jgi:hypothetical protein
MEVCLHGKDVRVSGKDNGIILGKLQQFYRLSGHRLAETGVLQKLVATAQ